MKKLNLLIIVTALVGCAHAQNSKPTTPEWRATVKVVDGENQPVANANVKVWYHIPPPEGQPIAMTNKAGLTDSSGIFTASEYSTSVELAFEAQKSGYYSAGLSYELGLTEQSDPVKWRPSITLMLKKIGRPIQMFAKRVRSQPPVSGQPVAYDLEIGDWVAPQGKGVRTDILFATYFDKRAESDWDYKVVVSFPNRGDGVQQFTISGLEKTSSLRSPHEAPDNGYDPEWVKTQSQRPGEGSVYGIGKNLKFFFRVRTVLDEKGIVKTANYGKIYGDFMNFQYYLNPTPNSRNVEFDPKQNLLKGLKSTEQVMEP